MKIRNKRQDGNATNSSNYIICSDTQYDHNSGAQNGHNSGAQYDHNSGAQNDHNSGAQELINVTGSMTDHYDDLYTSDTNDLQLHIMSTSPEADILQYLNTARIDLPSLTNEPNLTKFTLDSCTQFSYSEILKFTFLIL